MNPQTHKKKKHFRKKEDLDPIIKKVKVEKPKKEEPKIEEPEFDLPVEEEEEEKLNIDKFRDLFQEKKSKLQVKKARKEKEILNKINLKMPTVQYPQIEIVQKTEDPFNTHFGLGQDKLVKEKVDLIAQKNPLNTSDKLIQKDFNYAFEEEEEDLEILNINQETVTNQVKIKEYQLKPSLKGVGKVYQDQEEEVWASDLKAETSAQGNKGLLTKPVMHSAFEINAEMEDAEEDNRLKTVLPVMESYYDLVYTDANEEGCMKFRRLWILHMLNHIKKAQELETQNEKAKTEGEKNGEDMDTITGKLHKVRGYTRPRALIIVPYKGDAFEIISLINEIWSGKAFKTKNAKVQKFMEEFGNEEDMLDDDFKMGLAFKEKTMALYNPFVHSDVIIASPLVLRRIVGAKGDKEREYYFLSSIEIFIMERAHVVYMQNWQHIEEIMPMMNLIPRHKDMTSDINEIRGYYFDNLSKFYRQNIVHTEHKFAELNSISSRFFTNYRGVISNKVFYDRMISDTEVEVNQEFMKFDVDNFQKEADYRFEYFKTKVWDKIRFNEEYEKVILFVSSYFDFLRLRSYFKKINANVGYVSEYTDRNKVQSRVANFLNKKFKFMLVTERAFFFTVCKAKNFSNIVFYSLPRNASLYKELIFYTDKIREALDLPRDKARKITLRVMVKSMFCKFDALALERIVGSDKCKEYIAEYNKGTTFIL